MKILTILGARPQFIKAANLSREIAKYNNIKEIIIHTGQHFDKNMSDIFFEEMHIPKPDYFLGVSGQFHGAMTGQMMEKIEEIALIEKPDWILVYGDTNSTLAGSLVASKLNIKLAHVEAGLRSFNMNMPEEVNRILTDRVSSLLFCPTRTALNNLKNEGFENFNCKLIEAGDIMLEGIAFYKPLSKKPNIEVTDNFILCTIHRAENTDDEKRLKNIIYSLNEIGKEKQIVLPLHPRTRKAIASLNIKLSNISIIEPVGYLETIWLLDNCGLIMTDSGGLQKEAYLFLKPCLTLRDETEWAELLKSNSNILVGADKEKILSSYKNLNLNKMSFEEKFYGLGNTSKIIIKEIMEF